MVNYRSILYILGMMLSKVALLMYIPTIYALFTGSGGVSEFLQSVIITHVIAIILIAQGRGQKFYLRIRDMFLTTTLAWITACCFGALPFVLLSTSRLPMPFSKLCLGSRRPVHRFYLT